MSPASMPHGCLSCFPGTAPISCRACSHRWLLCCVNCISMTYFIGTSRWCKEVVDTLRTRPAARAPQHHTQTANVSLGLAQRADDDRRQFTGRRRRYSRTGGRSMGNLSSCRCAGGIQLYCAFVLHASSTHCSPSRGDRRNHAGSPPDSHRAWTGIRECQRRICESMIAYRFGRVGFRGCRAGRMVMFVSRRFNQHDRRGQRHAQQQRNR